MGGGLTLSTFVLVNCGSSGDLLASVGTFLFMQPASNLLPSIQVSGARPATLGQGRAWSKSGLQLSISAALPSLPHPCPPGWLPGCFSSSSALVKSQPLSRAPLHTTQRPIGFQMPPGAGSLIQLWCGGFLLFSSPSSSPFLFPFLF